MIFPILVKQISNKLNGGVSIAYIVCILTSVVYVHYAKDYHQFKNLNSGYVEEIA